MFNQRSGEQHSDILTGLEEPFLLTLRPTLTIKAHLFTINIQNREQFLKHAFLENFLVDFKRLDESLASGLCNKPVCI